MSIADFISKIRQQGVQLSFKDSSLKVALPKGLDPAIKSELIAKKEDVKQYLMESLGAEQDSLIEVSHMPYDFRPLSLSQKRLWFLDRFEEHSSHYNMPMALKIEGEFCISAATNALKMIIERHQVLRTVYVTQEEDPQSKESAIDQGKDSENVGQRLLTDVDFFIQEVDLSHLNEQQRNIRMQQLRQQDALTPFDLSQDLMLRATWVLWGNTPQGVIGSLLFNMHHIASDAWSMDILFNEFNFYYHQFAQGRNAELPPLPIQYSDYAIWQNRLLLNNSSDGRQALDRQQKYWQQQLADLPLIHSLPTDFSRAKELKTQGDSLSITIDNDLYLAVNRLAQAHQTTAFVIFHGAFSLLLARYSQESDIVIGTPVANRNNPQLAPLIGFFINTLVLRVDVDESRSIAEFIREVKEVNLAAQQHQDLPFDQIVDMLNPERTGNYNPLFQIMLNMYQGSGQSNTNAASSTANSVSSAADTSNIKVSHEQQTQTNAICDLVLSIYEHPIGAEFMFEFNTSLFRAETIKAMGQQLLVLLQNMTSEQAQCQLSQLSILQQVQTQRLLSQFDRVQDSHTSHTLHGIFEQQCKVTPNAIAAVQGQQSWSYSELNNKANQIADWLLAAAVPRHAVVGLIFNRSLEWLAAILGVMKAGAMYVPLDASLPKDRLYYILKQADVAMVLGQTSLLSIIEEVLSGREDTDREENSQETACQLKTIDQHFFSPDDFSDPQLDIQGDEPAYIYFTSGSTGKPKGAINSHNGAASMMLATRDELNLTPTDRFMQFAALGFDVVVEELFPIWFAGGTSVLREDNDILSAHEFQTFIENYQVTCVELTVPFWHTWVEVLCDNQQQPPDSLRFVIAGGDKVSLDIYQRWLSFNLPLYNAYGLTETGVTNVLFTEQNALTYSCFPIGKPIDNVSLFILDKHMQPVPNGVPGEVYIGGPGVGLGYINQPDLSQERFIQHSFAGQAARTLYKTGDLVRVLFDGNIEFIGRSDEQVKLRGFRIELSEIEAQLDLLPQIASSVALLQGEHQSKQLVAYYVAATADGLNTKQIPAHQLSHELQKTLPGYMVPSHFIQVERWPLTPNGKLNKRALPKPDAVMETELIVAPKTTTESTLAGIWANLLGRDAESISTQADFFALGGHSLLAVRMASEIRKQLKLEVSIKTIFIQSTVEKLAEFIDSQLVESLDSHNDGAAQESATVESLTPGFPPRPDVTRRPQSDTDPQRIPLSFSQQRLWFIDQLQGKQSVNYNLPMAVELKGKFDVNLAEQALAGIIQRHEVLRTVYVSEGTEVYQRVRTSPDFHIATQDLRGVEPELQSLQIKAEISRDVAQPFDLENDIPIRASWLQVQDDKGVLLFNMHHIASDGWSMNVLVSEFCVIYQGLQGARDSVPQVISKLLPDLEIQYADYARWQRQYLQGEVLNTQLDYWLSQLADAPVVHSLPLDRPRTEQSGQQGDVYSAKLPVELANTIKSVATSLGMTPFMVLHGILSLVIARHSGSHDIVMGSPVANRLQSELEPLIGFFVNTLVLRVDTSGGLSGQLSTADYLRRIKQIHLDAQDYQDIPFEQLVEHLQLPRDTAHNPLFQIMFTLDDEQGKQLSVDGIELTPLDEGTQAVKCDLDISVQFSDSGLHVSWVYDTSLFNEATVAGFHRHFTRLCDALLNRPLERSLSVAMLSQREEQELALWGNHLTAFHQADMPETGKHLLGTFEVASAAYPQHAAVVMADQSPGDHELSYFELNERANQLSHWLQKQGVASGTFVGILLPRSVDMVVAMLAVMKAGAAWVPMDVEYPASRLVFIAKDTKMKVLLTNRAVTNNETGTQASVGLKEQPDWPDSLCVSELDRDETKQQLTQMPKHNTDVLVAADSLAYVIYTSGSTGQPKGVMVEYQAISQHTASVMADYQFTADDAVLQLTSFAFDTFLEQSLAALCSGAKLVLTERLLAPERFFNIVDSHQITITDLPPAWLSECLHTAYSSEWQKSSLRLVVIGGEAVSKATLESWFALKLTNCQLVNGYGPTEGVITAAIQTLEPQDIGQTRIGQVFGARRLYVLDEFQQLAPAGSPGELYIGGPLIARGYLHREEENQTRFIPNPWQPGEGLYRTGDQVAYTASGELLYCGRVDEQVKIRGYRIEPGEVADHISAMEAVEDAFVAASEIAGQKRLLAWYKNADENTKQLNSNDLKAALAESLPKHMLPDSLICVAKWPLNHNGKIDKKRLPMPASVDAAEDLVNAESVSEKVMQTIWSRLLKTEPEQIGVCSNFFSLGGHSLLVIRLLSEVREKLGVELPVKSVFECPTIRELCRYMDENGEGTQFTAIAPVSRDQDDYPLSFAQQRLWFIDQLSKSYVTIDDDAGRENSENTSGTMPGSVGGTPQYNMPVAFTVSGDFDVDFAELAFKRIVQRHETLRTRFVNTPSGPRQALRTESNFAISRLNGKEDTLSKEQVKQLAASDAIKPFDLANDWLFKVSWAYVNEQSQLLMINMHHIISDGWSFENLTREFMLQYRSVVAGQPDPMPPLAIQYIDFANWQRQHLTGEVLQKQKDYWLTQLADAPAMHSLPLDRPRGNNTGRMAKVYSGKMPIELANSVKTLATELGMTPFMLLHGILCLVISRHSGSHDIVIGTPLANRMRAELEPLIGFFVNTLVLRLNTSGHASLADYFELVKQTHLDAQTFQDIPFEQLVEHLQLPRDTSYNPLFQIMFSLDENDGADLSLQDVQLTPLEEGTQTVKFDLDIGVSFTDSGLYVNWAFDTALFDETTIANIHLHFANLCGSLLNETRSENIVLPNHQEHRRAEQSLSEKSLSVSMLSQQEVQKLALWGHHEQHYEFDIANQSHFDSEQKNNSFLLHQGVEAMARLHPLRVAVAMQDDELTYLELNQRANQLAHWMQQQGISTGSHVGILLPRSVDLVVAMLAVLKTGAAYVPMDIEYPGTRLSFMAKDTDMQLLLTEERVAEPVDWPEILQTAVLSSISMQQQLEQMPAVDLKMAIPPSALAYIIYTSGSTGTPKGVMIEHRAIRQHICDVIAHYNFTKTDVVLQLSSFAFDAFVEQSYAALLSGAKVVITERLLAPEGFFEIVQRHKVTTALLPPAWLSECLYAHYRDNWLQSPVRLLVIGGEAVSRQTLEKWFALNLDGCELVNAYGPTEGVIVAATQSLARQDIDQTRIGQVFGQRRLYILDDFQQLAPPGSPGELYIGGPLIARGYLDRDAENLARFIPNPWKSGERLYRTGDRMVYEPDGALVYCGRVDDQVQIRGHRIEPDEIANQISTIEGIEDAFVQVVELEDNKRLLAWYKLTDANFEIAGENRNNSSLIKQKLAEVLPKYMMPDNLMCLSEWPLNHNGKIDKNRLPLPDTSGPGGELITAETDLEKSMVSIWSRLLQLEPEKIGVDTDFFSLGGHSLLVVKMLSAIKQALQLELPVKAVFDYATIRELCDHIESQLFNAESATSQHTEILPVARDQDNYPLSFSQQRLWFINELSTATGNLSAQYNMPVAFIISGDFDIGFAGQAFNRIVSRHESLRTNFVNVESGPRQVVRQPCEFDINNLNPAGEALSCEQVEQLAAKDANTPFDLASDWLFRVSWAYVDADRQLLLINMHHIISDGWSFSNLTNEFLTQYSAVVQGQADPLPALPIQYIDFASWQREYLTGEVLQTQKNYWLNHLQGVEPLHSLPMDYPRTDKAGKMGRVHSAILNPQVANKVKTVARSLNMTPFMLLHGVLSLVIARHSSHHDVLIGTPVANRLKAELQPLIGFFVNTLVLRLDMADYMSGDTSVADYLKYVKQTHLDAQSHQDFPFEQLVDSLHLPRDTAYNPLFQIMFSMDEAATQVQALELDDIVLTPLEESSQMVKFDLDISAQFAHDGLHLNWLYDVALFTENNIARLQQHFTQLLSAVLDSQGDKLCEVSMLSTSETAFLLNHVGKGNATDVNLLPVHKQFEQQVIASPNSIAVQMANEGIESSQLESTRLTYSELNTNANQFAHYLLEQGLSAKASEAESLVGVWLPRSTEIVVAILAILKAGAAYVPMDREYPQARVQSILADSQLKTLITTAELAQSIDWPEGVNLIIVDSPELPAKIQKPGWERNPQVNCRQSHLAYVIYTSGSTGKPKGVMIEHRSLCHYLEHVARQYTSSDNDYAYDNAVLSTSISFDATVTTLFGALISGRGLVLVEEAEQGIYQLGELLMGTSRSDNAVCLFKVTPAHLNLLRQLRSSSETVSLPHTLVIGGEQLAGNTLNYWQQQLPNARFVNEYGPTEATVGCAVYIQQPGSNAVSEQSAVPIGKAIGNCHLYILDESQQPVPQGVAGELYIAGPALARGYLNRTQETAKRFLTNPFSHDVGYDRLYRTGDSVRLMPCGNMEFLNRLDEQVKVRGYRIELEEINHHLRQSQYVESSFSMVKTHANNEQQLLSFMYLKPLVEDDLTTLSGSSIRSQLRRQLQQTLPAYMMPDSIIEVQEWPLTANGKVDARALLKLRDELQIATSDAIAVANNETEKQLVPIWSSLLAIAPDKLSVDADFFALGGNSVSLIRLANQINKTFNTSLNVAQLMQSSSIRECAALLESAGSDLASEFSAFTCVNSGNQVPGERHVQENSIVLLFPAAGMTSAFYRSFSELSIDSPVFVAEPFNSQQTQQGGDFQKGNIFGYESLDDWVQAVRQWLAEYHPGNSVHIVGHSFGGYPAFKLACELEASLTPVSLTLVESMLFNAELFNEETVAQKAVNEELVNEALTAKDLDPMHESEEATLSAMAELYQQQLSWIRDYQSTGLFNGTIAYIFGEDTILASESKSHIVNNTEAEASLKQRIISNIEANCSRQIKVEKCSGDHFSMFSISNIANLWQLINQ